MLGRLKNEIPTIVSLVATAALLIITLLWFNNSIGGRVENTNEAYLIENTKALASVFGTKLDDQLIMLESQTRYFEDIDLSDYNVMKDTIMSTKGIGAFKTIGVANAAGATINYNGKSSGNILLKDFFQSAMNGETTVSETFLTDEEGVQVLMVGIPIVQKGSVVGVIFGTFGKEVLSRLINLSGFDKEGISLLLDRNGNILAASDGYDADKTGVRNIFTDTQAEKPAKNRDSVTNCMFGGTDSIIAMTPVGVHDWYFAAVLPKSYVDKQSYAISGDVLMLVAFIALAFIMMFVSILYLLKSNDDIKRSNERFRLVTVESQDMVFDYNYQKQLLTLDGSTESITTDSRNEFSRADMLAFFDLIHEEDTDIKDRILAVSGNDETTVRGEFRLKCLDGNYRWFRMKATVVRGHDGSAQRMIGSFINADDQMNRDSRLVEKAETDPLTGILHKSAFYDKVNQMLKDASDSDLFAVYIIDLDNFKQVNDDLGHAMGDQVLGDVAKKLCLVFSDKDYVGRIGGDEFAAFLHLSSKARNVGMSIIEGKAQAICAQMRETYSAKKKSVSVTASVGVAIYPYSGRDYNTLFIRAGKALEKIKDTGKNMYAVYSPEEHEK